MKHLQLLLIILLLPLCAQSEDIYHIRQLSEREALKTYTAAMLDACRHADKLWQDFPADPRAGYWGTGRSDQWNEGIRAVGGMVLTCGALLKYSDNLSDSDRQEYLKKATHAIRYAVSTHVSGTQRCVDGKPWGANWQSAMWTGTLGFGAWLIWDKLDPELQKGVERVIAFEADRFLKDKPPTGRWLDTKAEENGWDMTCISLASVMFPAHPHAAAWKEKAAEYMINTLSVPQDAQDKSLADGRPVSEWFAGANLQPDFTLENHNIFHPSYVACSSYFMTQAAMYSTYAGRPVPQAATHHLMDTWKMFQTIILPTGESAYPQGMDWELHGLSYINLYASLASYQKDALAARMEEQALQYIRAWQTMRKGDLAVPGSSFGFTRHAICAEQLSYAFLAHKLFGPPTKEISARKAAAQVKGVWTRSYVEFIAHRTENKFVSFSWKNRMMGVLLPIGQGHEGNPDFTVPITSGFVGSIELTPKGKPGTKPLEHLWKEMPNGFETTGALSINGGLLKQALRVTSLGEKAVIYQDRVTALSDVCMSQELGAPVGIENDEVTGGQRVVYYRDGKTTFDWKKPQPSLAIPGSWVNVDGRLGAVMAIGSGMRYKQGAGYDPHTAVCADVLYGSFLDRPKKFKAGEEVAHRVVLFFTEVTPRKTAALAQSIRIEKTEQGQVLHFKLPESGEAEIPLL